MKDLLLKNGLDVNAKDKNGRTPLNHVKRLEDAKALIHAGAKIDKALLNYNLWNIADTELAQILIDQGVDFNRINDDRASIFYQQPALLFTNNPEVVKLLLKAGADVHVRDGKGRTVLMRSEIFGENFVRELDKMGIEHDIGYAVAGGLDVPENAEAAMKARKILKQCIDDNREIIKLLIDAGADVNASAYNGDTALTNTHDPETVKLLLTAGANPNGGKPHKPETEISKETDSDEYSKSNNKKKTEELPHNIPIITALNNPESLKLLLDAGADPNAEDHDGFTALSSVFLNGRTIEKKRELAQILINAGADINQISHIRNHGSYPEAPIVCICAEMKDVDTLKLAIELGADVNALYNRGESILSKTQNYEKIKVLLDAGADPNGGKSTHPPIVCASINAYHKRDILELLLAKGANPNAEDYDGQTALFRILTDSSLNIEIKRELAQMLINAGADINHKTSQKVIHKNEILHETVITRIIRMTNGKPNRWDDNYIESLKLAIELGADVNVVCEENKPLTEQTNNQEVIKILKEAGVKC